MLGDPVAIILVRQKPWIRIGCVLAGAVLIHLSLGTYHTFGNMLPYMASYMRNHTDSSIKIEQMIWIPTIQGCFPFAMVIGGIMSNKLGPRIAASIGCYIMVAGVFLSYYTIQMSYWLFLFTYGVMFGFGQGVAYVIAVACVINWAPEKVGLVSGIVAGGFGISSSIFAPIQTKMINPLNVAPTSDGYFTDPALIERVPSTFIKLSIVYFLMQTIGLIFVCDPPAESISDDPARQRRSGSEMDDDTKIIVESGDGDDDADNHQPPQPVSLHPRDVLKSSTFYCLFVALFCCSFYGNLWYNLYKTFGETFIEDDMFLAIAFSIGTVANSIARIGWGLLTDKTSFQFALSIASCLATVLLLTMPITALFGKMMYLIWLTLMFVCLAATHALFITASVRCFGIQYKIVNYGFLILSTTLSGTFLAAGTQALLSVIGYNWLFVISSCFPFLAFLIVASIRVTPQGHLII